MSNIGGILVTMFGWPNGIVVGNLLASLITFTAGFLWGRRGLRRLHRRLDTAETQRAETHELVTELHRLHTEGKS